MSHFAFHADTLHDLSFHSLPNFHSTFRADVVTYGFATLSELSVKSFYLSEENASSLRFMKASRFFSPVITNKGNVNLVRLRPRMDKRERRGTAAAEPDVMERTIMFHQPVAIRGNVIVSSFILSPNDIRKRPTHLLSLFWVGAG